MVLIAMNPFQRVTLYGPEIIQAYSGRKKGELEPHLFAIAEDAHTRMRTDNLGQTIIVSGESGAGKTESVSTSFYVLSFHIIYLFLRRQNLLCDSWLPLMLVKTELRRVLARLANLAR